MLAEGKEAEAPKGSAYSFAEVEARWQKHWQDIELFRCDLDDRKRERFYALVMFPYPSGSLHMGHVLNYTLGDVFVRYQIMCGKNVFSPIGWDAFGLPAESAAVRAGVHPDDWTSRNIQQMREQMKRMGWGYDWSAELGTHTPEYYRWTQWIFLKMHERGLAYRKKALVNWCPHHETVLANEQVVDGKCERCSTPVLKKNLEQWFFRITDYVERLLDDMKQLEHWPRHVLKRQTDWIGKSSGARVDFSVPLQGESFSLPVYTTRADTLWGVTFVAVAAEHELVQKLLSADLSTEKRAEIESFTRQVMAQSVADRIAEAGEKLGLDTGFKATNPVNGEAVPVFITNYVVMDYGTGAVMAVPAHDQRDFEFAKLYDLPIKVVIQDETKSLDVASMTCAFTGDGIQADTSEFSGMPNSEARDKIIAWLEKKNIGSRTTNYRIRDWLISRQRYWGAPIPFVYSEDDTPHAVSESDLPVMHPRDVAFKGIQGNPLAQHAEFVSTTVPGLGKVRRETDTMDTFVDSSWYFVRYLSATNSEKLVDEARAKHWLPIDLYIGGDEHAVLHLLYARFISKVLFDLGLIPCAEPVKTLFCQGMVSREAYYLEADRRVWVSWEDVDAAKGIRISDGARVLSELGKMSKTKLNGVSPDSVLARYGADVLRTYILFAGPPDKDLTYQDDGLIGIERFLRRVRETVLSVKARIDADSRAYSGSSDDLSADAKKLWRKCHLTIAAFTEAAEGSFAWNTSIARLMETVSELRQFLGTYAETEKLDATTQALAKFAIESVLKLLAPVSPHLAEELWSALGHGSTIFRSGWPSVDERAHIASEVEVVFQVNGKFCGKASFPTGSSQTDVKQKALADQRVAARLANKSVAREVYVPDKLFNIVVR